MDPVQTNKIKRIILDNKYLTLATIDITGGNPLVTPVFFANDSTFTCFYWVSAVNAQHSQNINHHHQISIVIFDSTAPSGDAFGVFMSGRADVLISYDEIKIADELLRIKCNSDEIRSPDYYDSPHPRRIYKFVHRDIWTNIQTPIDCQLVDERSQNF